MNKLFEIQSPLTCSKTPQSYVVVRYLDIAKYFSKVGKKLKKNTYTQIPPNFCSKSYKGKFQREISAQKLSKKGCQKQK